MTEPIDDDVLTFPPGKYQTILADPPWPYDDRVNDKNRGALNHYSLMTIEDIASLPVPEVTAQNAHLYLCTTNAFMDKAYVVARAWGFTPKTIITWVKTTNDGSGLRLGMGHYFRNVTEHVVFCTKGKTTPLVRNIPTAFFAPRLAHSEKPEALYNIVRSMSTGPRLEMFARRNNAGFIPWGLESPTE